MAEADIIIRGKTGSYTISFTGEAPEGLGDISGEQPLGAIFDAIKGLEMPTGQLSVDVEGAPKVRTIRTQKSEPVAAAA